MASFADHIPVGVLIIWKANFIFKMEVFLLHSITQETVSGGQLNIKAASKKPQKQALHYAAHKRSHFYFNKQNGSQSISDKTKYDK